MTMKFQGGKVKKSGLLAAFIALLGATVPPVQAECLSDGQEYADRFVLRNDGTVLDRTVGLVWKRCLEGQSFNLSSNTCTGYPASYGWRGAMRQAASHNDNGGFADSTNWRVPNIKELATLVRRDCRNPAVDTERFPLANNRALWSNTPSERSESQAYVIDLSSGLDSAVPRDSFLSVRLVRDGAN